MAVTSAISDFVSSIYELFASFFSTLFHLVSTIFNAVIGFFTGIFNLIVGTVGSVLEVVGETGKFLLGQSSVFEQRDSYKRNRQCAFHHHRWRRLRGLAEIHALSRQDRCCRGQEAQLVAPWQYYHFPRLDCTIARSVFRSM